MVNKTMFWNPADEEKNQIPGAIGIEAAVRVPKLNLANDRTLYKWQTYARLLIVIEN
ncbi:hypothetical protein [Pseudorhodobacter wandonensis]|uniref:hypothetical protein n=1 Tax=Pseudorhodobacter wandonensis TaxID=1120568 RepID=UPI0012E31780|nr:hypothetical protein [Pseudorhodobacter wandonensis]